MFPLVVDISDKSITGVGVAETGDTFSSAKTSKVKVLAFFIDSFLIPFRQKKKINSPHVFIFCDQLLDLNFSACVHTNSKRLSLNIAEGEANSWKNGGQ